MRKEEVECLLEKYTTYGTKVVAVLISKPNIAINCPYKPSTTKGGMKKRQHFEKHDTRGC